MKKTNKSVPAQPAQPVTPVTTVTPVSTVTPVATAEPKQPAKPKVLVEDTESLIKPGCVVKHTGLDAKYKVLAISKERRQVCVFADPIKIWGFNDIIVTGFLGDITDAELKLLKRTRLNWD